VSFSGDSNFADSSQVSNWITVNVPDFSLNLGSTPLNVTAGQSATLQFNVTPLSTNASPVTLACNGNLPSGYSCSLQPATVNLVNGVASPVVLTISPSPSGTAAPANIAPRKHNAFLQLPFGQNPLWPLTLLSGFAALLALICASKKKTLRLSFGFGLVCILSLIIGCGGGSSGGGPPPPPPGPSATTTVLTLSSAKVAPNAALTFTAKVTGQGSPSGSVDFYANGNWIGNSNLLAGSAALNTSFSFPGIYSISAHYAGNTNNLASASSPASEAITGTTIFQVSGTTGALFHSVDVTVNLQ
jgi:hypothetical protein